MCSNIFCHCSKHFPTYSCKTISILLRPCYYINFTSHAHQIPLAIWIAVLIGLLQRQADGTVVANAMFPVANNLPRRTAVGNRAALAGLTCRHVIQDVLHRLAVRQRALPRLAVRLRLPPLALVGVQQQHQLLLD